MIDVHSHIVFDVDDGPKTLEESLSLIAESYAQGVRTIVSTSHRRKDMFETSEEKILKNFMVVKTEAEKCFEGLTICYGGELYFTMNLLEKLKHGQVPTLNQSQYVLIEFSMGTPWSMIEDGLRSVLMLGLIPLVAHIERYNALDSREDRVQKIIDMGCYTQINSCHVLPKKLFGDKLKVFKKRAYYFLERNLVHCVASDMHNLSSRPPYLKEAYKIIEKRYGRKMARKLFEINPKRMLENKEMWEIQELV